MKGILLLMLMVIFSADAFALEVGGAPVEQSVAVNGQTLQLNGAGIRKKLFVKVYVGSLYAGKHLSSAGEVFQDPGDKLIRMKFVHGKVGKEKIVEVFAEGFANNAPEVAASSDGKNFLAFFTDDFVKGDTVDLLLGADGTVTAKQNGKVMGTVKSGKLAHGILAIYFGEKPADEGLKKGMLGITN